MSLLSVVVVCAIILGLAYRLYGGLLSRLLRLDPEAKTPAVEMRDDVDYVPIEPKFLLGQHLSAIAAAGPIVGPILAGVMFGWLPALVWILLGAIFIGGVHDKLALVASVRHKARSIAEVVREHMSRRAHLLFLAFIWIALIYVVVAFTDITASSFVGLQTLENGQVVSGGGIATSSLLYLLLPILLGLVLRYTKVSLGMATAIFIPLVGLAIWGGQKIPFDLPALTGLSELDAKKVWNVLILVYCFVAAMLPMWLLLQPRGHLGGYFLLFALGGGALGLIFGGKSVEYPAFLNWSTPKGDTLFPMLFITIACGACSGFHALIASGTTSKQLRNETDAKPVAYGSMLLEAMVAIISLACVMMLATNSPLLQKPQPNFIYAQGIGSFLTVLGIPVAFAVSFGLMAFTTFVYDTLDVCTRLGRYVLQELMGWHDRKGKWAATFVTAVVPLILVTQTMTDAAGKPIPAWRVFWELFGASNQLLAALTLLGVTVWLWKRERKGWVWLIAGLPTLFMYIMSVWALTKIIGKSFAAGFSFNPVPWVGIALVALAAVMLVEAVRILLESMRISPPGEPVTAPSA